jgi:hypothetical protein
MFIFQVFLIWKLLIFNINKIYFIIDVYFIFIIFLIIIGFKKACTTVKFTFQSKLYRVYSFVNRLQMQIHIFIIFNIGFLNSLCFSLFWHIYFLNHRWKNASLFLIWVCFKYRVWVNWLDKFSLLLNSVHF